VVRDALFNRTDFVMQLVDDFDEMLPEDGFPLVIGRYDFVFDGGDFLLRGERGVEGGFIYFVCGLLDFRFGVGIREGLIESLCFLCYRGRVDRLSEPLTSDFNDASLMTTSVPSGISFNLAARSNGWISLGVSVGPSKSRDSNILPPKWENATSRLAPKVANIAVAAGTEAHRGGGPPLVLIDEMKTWTAFEWCFAMLWLANLGKLRTVYAKKEPYISLHYMFRGSRHFQ
jgi:hypothetical protein